MTRIGDEEPLALGIGEDLAGVKQRASRRPFHLGGELQRREVQLASGFVDFNELADHAIDGLEIPLATGAVDIFSVGVDQDQCGPAIDSETVPDGLVGVVHDGVLDTVFGHLAADVLGIALGRELGGMHADDNKLVLVFGFELGKVEEGRGGS